MQTITTTAQLDTIAPSLDAEAREMAHARMDLTDGSAESVREFCARYVAAVAYCLGQRSAAECTAQDEWAPDEWLQGDWDALRDEAASVGVDLSTVRTADLWRCYLGEDAQGVAALDVIEALRAVEVAPATRYRVEVRGTFAGAAGGWRPACSGTENQTGESDEEASTFDTLDAAQGYEDHLRSLCEDGDDARFQVVEVA